MKRLSMSVTILKMSVHHNQFQSVQCIEHRTALLVGSKSWGGPVQNSNWIAVTGADRSHCFFVRQEIIT